MDKREGSGSHNWGTVNDDYAGQVEGEADVSATAEEEPKVEGQENTENKENGTVEEEPKTMTLDEWKKEQEAKRKKPQFNIRKPGEGDDPSKWGDGYVLKKQISEEPVEEIVVIEVVS